MKLARMVKRFAPYYKPHMKVFILDLLCALLSAVAGLVFPMLVRYLLNDCLSTDNISWTVIIGISCAMLGVKIVELFCTYFMTTVGHIMGARVEESMRRELYVKMLSLSASFYDDRQVGDLMSRINNDLFDITEFAHHCPEEILLAVVRLVGVFTYLSFINIYLTLILFALLPPLVLFAIINNRRMRRTFSERRRQISTINSQLEDSLSGISVVRSFAGEQTELKKFDKNNADFVAIKDKSYKIMGVFHSGTAFSSGLMYLLTVVFGVAFIKAGAITTVDLIAYLLYVSTLMTTVTTVMNYTEQFQNGASALERFLEIMDEEPKIVNKPDAVKVDKIDGVIEFKNVTFSYDGTKDVL
ncbi:MAG: ABC transporter ATP-binding protein, partial [Clostridia bacterium]|nr:ABC transporter ATP-binding protein [Clostridia bacterium]